MPTNNREVLNTPPQYRRFTAGASTASDAQVERHGGYKSQGLIRGASLVTRGEALGHDFWLDSEFVASVAAGVNAEDQGVKSRFTHPGLSSDGLATHLGRAMNAAIDGDQAIADLHFVGSAHHTPDGDLAGYVMDMAEESPADIAISIVFEPDTAAEEKFFLANGGRLRQIDNGWETYTQWDFSEFKSPDPQNVDNLPHARVKQMRAADFVGDPAANPGGLFQREQLFAAEGSALASYALGLSKDRPTSVALGLDADRVRDFFGRYLAANKLEIHKKMENVSNDNSGMNENQPAEVAPVTEPVAETPATDPVEPKPAAETAPVVSAADPSRNEAAKFHKAFGERGAVMYANGLSFEQAYEATVTELRSENETIKTKLAESLSGAAELTKQLAKFQGEETPVTFDGANDKGGKKSGFAGKVRFATAATPPK